MASVPQHLLLLLSRSTASPALASISFQHFARRTTEQPKAYLLHFPDGNGYTQEMKVGGVRPKTPCRQYIGGTNIPAEHREGKEHKLLRTEYSYLYSVNNTQLLPVQSGLCLRQDNNTIRRWTACSCTIVIVVVIALIDLMAGLPSVATAARPGGGWSPKTIARSGSACMPRRHKYLYLYLSRAPQYGADTMHKYSVRPFADPHPWLTIPVARLAEGVWEPASLGPNGHQDACTGLATTEDDCYLRNTEHGIRDIHTAYRIAPCTESSYEDSVRTTPSEA